MKYPIFRWGGGGGGGGVKNHYIGVNQDFANSSKGWGEIPQPSGGLGN